MKKTLWTIFKTVTFGLGILVYVGQIATVYEHIRKPEPICPADNVHEPEVNTN